ncbi:GAF domain-containing protein [Nocardia arizonensis]|uniref:GAF domain-containing protein n=1 Tax=Nocardia arizonensis TaxID=1141647 RepID=UPI0006D03DC5|nr:GAF domain-containing protein [Nocardia arizonensis]
MWGEWLLIECMRAEPTVMAVGRKPAKLQPLRRALRGPALRVARRLTAQVRASGHAWEQRCRDRDEHMIAEPVHNLAGRVHGVRVWTGAHDQDPPPAPRSGAFDWNLDKTTVLLTEESYDIHAVAPEQRRPEITRMQAMRWLVHAEEEGTALALAAESDQNTLHHDTWQIMRDDGIPRDLHFCARGGQVDGQRFIHGLMLDISEGRDIPAPPPPLTFSRAVLHAELSVPGIYHALVDPATLTAHRWLGDPMPGIAWELGDDPDRAPGLHPDDIPAARELIRRLDKGPVTGSLRLRNTDGGWTSIHVEAKRMLLTRHPESAAALVSVSHATANE